MSRQRCCTALQFWASARLCDVEQRAPPIFGRAAITLGIRPHSSYWLLLLLLLLGRIAALARCGRLLQTQSCGLSACNDCEQCQNGWTDRNAICDVDSVGPKELSVRWRSRYPVGKGTFDGGWRWDFPTSHWASFPLALFPCVLFNSIPSGRLQKQSSVALNFPYEKSSPVMRPVLKFFDHLSIDCIAVLHRWSLLLQE